MKQLHLKQGEAAWHAHRINARNASEAAAVLGCHPQKTRLELLHEKKVGMAREHSQFVQERVFAGGHAIEAKLRPVAEAIIGEEIYPVVGTQMVDDIELSASFDGLPLFKLENWECKSLNDELRAALPMPGPDGNDAANLPKYHRVQMQQQCMVGGLTRTMFTASDGNGDDRHCWFYPDADLGREIIAGWKQFDIDLKAYVPVEVLDKPVIIARRPDQLPALRSVVKGELVLESNIKEWEEAAMAYIQGVAAHELKTDEDFENADAAVKWCVSSKSTMLGVQASLMSSIGDVNVAVDTINRIAEQLDKTRIAFTKQIDARKAARKGEMLIEHQTLLADHLRDLNKRLGRDFMPQIPVDFAGAIHGKRSFDSMGAALNTALANGKIEANREADKIAVNLRVIDEKAKDHGFLFNDLATSVLMENDHFALMVDKRIGDHVAAENDRLEKERERIRLEEKAKLERAADVQRHIDLITKQGEHLEIHTLEELRFIRESIQNTILSAEQLDDRVPDAQAAKASVLALLDAAIEAATPPPVETPAAVAQPVVAPEPAAQPDPAMAQVHAVVRAATPPAARQPVKVNTPPTLTLGQIGTRLGFSLTAAFLSGLGFDGEKVKGAVLFHEEQYPQICDALIRHVAKAKEPQAA